MLWKFWSKITQEKKPHITMNWKEGPYRMRFWSNGIEEFQELCDGEWITTDRGEKGEDIAIGYLHIFA